MTPNSRNTRIAALSLAVVAIALIVVAIAVILAVRPTGVPVVQAAAGGESAAPAAVTSGLITPQQYTAQYVDGGAAHQLVDVRTPEEYAEGHIAGAKNVDFLESDFEKQVAALERDKTYLIHCASGSRSMGALPLFQKLGFTSLYHLDGGFSAWKRAGKPVTK